MTSAEDRAECYCCQAEVPIGELKDVARYFHGKFDEGEEYMVCEICWMGWVASADVYGRRAHGPRELYKQMSIYTRLIMERLDELGAKLDVLVHAVRFPGDKGPHS